jgi:hypothetical protein
LAASAARIDAGSGGEFLPDSIRDLKSAVRITTPDESSNPGTGIGPRRRKFLIIPSPSHREGRPGWIGPAGVEKSHAFGARTFRDGRLIIALYVASAL